jgi:AAA family ATP:ADP antiporter
MDARSTSSFPVFRTVGGTPRGRLDRALSIFADVRAGEGGTALLLAFTAFLIFFSYYLIKPVREALVLTEQSANVAAYAAGAQALLLLAVIPAFAKLASVVNRQSLITWVTLFFASHLMLFYLFGKAGAREAVPFFIWLGIFNTIFPAQFWAFANDIYSESQGRRLFPIVGAGAMLGALSGAASVAILIAPIGIYELMLVTAGVVSSTIVLIRLVNRRVGGRAIVHGREEQQGPIDGAGASAFRLIFRERYLLLIALLVVVLNVVNTNGETLLRKLVVLHAEREGIASADAMHVYIGEFYGQFQIWMNLFGVFVQFFLVSRIFHYIGVGGALFVLPLIALTGYSAAALAPALVLVRAVKIVENGTDYTLQNTAGQALFLVTTREAKYKAKAAIDSFFMRSGDVLAAGVVFAASQIGFSVAQFASANVAFTIVWLVIVSLIYREHKRRARMQEPNAV